MGLFDTPAAPPVEEQEKSSEQASKPQKGGLFDMLRSSSTPSRPSAKFSRGDLVRFYNGGKPTRAKIIEIKSGGEVEILFHNGYEKVTRVVDEDKLAPINSKIPGVRFLSRR